MNPLENELKKALSRKEPSAGFTQRVLDEVASRSYDQAVTEPVRKSSFWFSIFSSTRLRWATASLILGLIVGLGAYRYQEQRRLEREKELTKRQVLLALQIASSKLNRAERLVVERMENLSAQ